jgi:hypothetical protein
MKTPYSYNESIGNWPIKQKTKRFMKKSTNTKKTVAKKATSKKTASKKTNSSAKTKRIPNVQYLSNGSFRVRKMINGVNYSEYFTKLSQAQNYLTNLCNINGVTVL